MGRKKEGRTVVFGLPAHSVRVQVAVINTPPQVANDISRHMYHNKDQSDSWDMDSFILYYKTMMMMMMNVIYAQ